MGEALGLYSTEKRAGKVRLIATENPRLRHKIRPQWSEIDEGLLAGSTVLARISTDMMNPTWRAHPSAVQAMPAQCRAASWRDPHVSENRRGNHKQAGLFVIETEDVRAAQESAQELTMGPTGRIGTHGEGRWNWAGAEQLRWAKFGAQGPKQRFSSFLFFSLSKFKYSNSI